MSTRTVVKLVDIAALLSCLQLPPKALTKYQKSRKMVYNHLILLNMLRSCDASNQSQIEINFPSSILPIIVFYATSSVNYPIHVPLP